MSADTLVFSPPASTAWGGYLIRHDMGEVCGWLKEEGHDFDQKSLFVECRYLNRHRFHDDPINLTPFQPQRAIKHLNGDTDPEIQHEANKLANLLDIDRYGAVIAPVKEEHIIPQNDLRLLITLSIMKERAADKLTIIGGPDPDKMDVAQFPFIDYAIRGDQEIPLTNILNHEFNSEDLQTEPGVMTEKDGEIHHGHPYKHPMEDKAKPYYDPDLVRKEAKLNALNLPIIRYQLGRGCTQNCSFCMYYEDQTYQYKSVDKVVRELKEIKQDLGIDHVFFPDENLFNDPEYMKELALRFREEKLGIEWAGQTIIVPREQEFFDTLAAGGCKALQHGIESASNTVLHRMNKHQTRTMIENTLKKEHNAGIKTIALLMTDYVDETPEEYFETIDFIRQNPHLAGYRVASLQVVPDERQPLYRDPEQFDIEIEPDDWAGGEFDKMLPMFSVSYRDSRDGTASEKHERRALKERYLAQTAGIELHLKNFGRRHPIAFLRHQLHKLNTQGCPDISHYYA